MTLAAEDCVYLIARNHTLSFTRGEDEGYHVIGRCSEFGD